MTNAANGAAATPSAAKGCAWIIVGIVVLFGGGLGLSVLTGDTPVPTWLGGDGNPDDIRIESVDVAYTVRPNGTVHVKRTMKYDFNGVRRHGPEVPITRRASADKAGYDEIYRISNLRVSSPTGAPDVHHTERVDDGNVVAVRVGDEDEKITGKQTYQVSYDLTGRLSTDSVGAVDFDDEPITDDLDAPVRKLTARVTGPAKPQYATCLSCTERIAGGQARFTGSNIARDDRVSIGVTYPEEAADAIAVPKPRTVRSDSTSSGPVYGKSPDLWGWLVVGLIGLLVIGRLLQVLLLRIDRRPNTSGDPSGGAAPPGSTGPTVVNGTVVTPGTPGMSGTPGPAGPPGRPGTAAHAADAITAPAYLPPRPTGVTRWDPRGPQRPLDLPAVTPAEAGIVRRRRSHRDQAIATLLDLAARGYVVIYDRAGAPGVQGHQRWLVQARPGVGTDVLAEHELALLGRLSSAGFSGQPGIVVPSENVRAHAAYTSVAQVLRQRAKAAGWLRRKAPSGSSRWTWIWAVLCAAAAYGLVSLNIEYGLGNGQVIMLAALGAGAVLALASYVSPGRGATGQTIVEQTDALGGELGTVPAPELQHTEEVDLYGRFLPWAVLYDCEEHWLAVCDELTGSGRAQPPVWYVTAAYAGAAQGGQQAAATGAATMAEPATVAGGVPTQGAPGQGSPPFHVSPGANLRAFVVALRAVRPPRRSTTRSSPSSSSSGGGGSSGGGSW